MLLILSLFNLSALSTEQVTRRAIEVEVQRMYLEQENERLIKLTTQYLNQQSRTDSGVWKHVMIYFGLAELFDRTRTSEKYWEVMISDNETRIERHPDEPLFYLVQAGIYFNKITMYQNTRNPGDRTEYKAKVQQVLETMRNFLEQHKTVASADPKYYEWMIHVARQQQWDDHSFQDLLTEATNRFPAYHQIYFAAVDYFMANHPFPDSAIETMARKTMNQQSTTESQALYARIHWYEINQCECNEINFTDILSEQSDLDWTVMMTSVRQILLDYPDQWNINNFAYFACYSGEATDALWLLEQVQGEPLPSVWQADHLFVECREWAETTVGFKNQQF